MHTIKSKFGFFILFFGLFLLLVSIIGIIFNGIAYAMGVIPTGLWAVALGFYILTIISTIFYLIDQK